MVILALSKDLTDAWIVIPFNILKKQLIVQQQTTFHNYLHGSGEIGRLWLIPIPHIRKYHHFRFHASNPGKVYVKEHTNSVEKEISIFKKDVTAAKVCKAKLPKAILPAGLTRERQEYLHKEVRPYVKLEYQDVTCPPLD